MVCLRVDRGTIVTSCVCSLFVQVPCCTSHERVQSISSLLDFNFWPSRGVLWECREWSIRDARLPSHHYAFRTSLQVFVFVCVFLILIV